MVGTAGHGEYAAIPQRQQCWIPSPTRGHVLQTSPLLRNRIEGVGAVQTDKSVSVNVVLLRAPGHNYAAVGQKALASAKEIYRREWRYPFAVGVIPDRAAQSCRIEFVVAGAREEQNFASMQDGTMDRQQRSVTRQQFPDTLGRKLRDVGRRSTHSRHRRHDRHWHPCHAWHVSRWRIVVVVTMGRLFRVTLLASRQINIRARIYTVVVRKLDIDLFCDGFVDPYVLARPHQTREPGHHVFFDMAMEEELPLQAHATRFEVRLALKFLECTWKSHRGWDFGIGDERL